MKTTQLFRVSIIVLACATFAGGARAGPETTRDSTGAGTKDAGAPGSIATSQTVAVPSTASATAKWDEIKDLSYDARDLFFAGLKQLDATVDGQVKELTDRRAAMKSTANTKEWDFAMKEMNDSRSYLKSVGDELKKASVETWNQQKETVGLAWVRTQNAYNAVKKSTTS
jgi:hypothetical protein